MLPSPTSPTVGHDNSLRASSTNSLSRAASSDDLTVVPSNATASPPSAPLAPSQHVKRKRGRPPKPKSELGPHAQDAPSSPLVPTPSSGLQSLLTPPSNNDPCDGKTTASTITVVNGFTWCSRCQYELNQDKAGLSPLDFSHCLHASQDTLSHVQEKTKGRVHDSSCSCLETLLEQDGGVAHKMPALLSLSKMSGRHPPPLPLEDSLLTREETGSSTPAGSTDKGLTSAVFKNDNKKRANNNSLHRDDGHHSIVDQNSSASHVVMCDSCGQKDLVKSIQVGALSVCSICADIFRDAGATRGARRLSTSLVSSTQKLFSNHKSRYIGAKKTRLDNTNTADKVAEGLNARPYPDSIQDKDDAVDPPQQQPKSKLGTVEDESIIVVDDDTIPPRQVQNDSCTLTDPHKEEETEVVVPTRSMSPLPMPPLDQTATTTEPSPCDPPPIPKKRGRPRKSVSLVTTSTSINIPESKESTSKKQLEATVGPSKPIALPQQSTTASNSHSTSFLTTGAFLTRRASKLLLSGQQAQAVDCNVYGYAYGRKVRVKHRNGILYYGSMVDLDHDRIRVRFDGWSEEWDEWINADNRRLQILTPGQISEYEAMLQQQSDSNATPNGNQEEEKIKEIPLRVDEGCITKDVGDRKHDVALAPSGKDKQAASKKRQKSAVTKVPVNGAVVNSVTEGAPLTEVVSSSPTITDVPKVKGKLNLVSAGSPQESTNTKQIALFASQPSIRGMPGILDFSNIIAESTTASSLHNAFKTASPAEVPASTASLTSSVPGGCASLPPPLLPSVSGTENAQPNGSTKWQARCIEALLQASKEESVHPSTSSSTADPAASDFVHDAKTTMAETAIALALTPGLHVDATSAATGTTMPKKRATTSTKVTPEIQLLLDLAPVGTRVQLRNKGCKRLHDATVVEVQQKKVRLRFEQDVNNGGSNNGVAREDVWLLVTSKRLSIPGAPASQTKKDKAKEKMASLDGKGSDGVGSSDTKEQSSVSAREKENAPLGPNSIISGGTPPQPATRASAPNTSSRREKMADKDPNTLPASTPATASKKRKVVESIDENAEKSTPATNLASVMTNHPTSSMEKTAGSVKSLVSTSNERAQNAKKDKLERKKLAVGTVTSPLSTQTPTSSSTPAGSPCPKDQSLSAPNVNEEDMQESFTNDDGSNKPDKKMNATKPVQEIPPLPPPLPITGFEFENPTAEILKIVHYVLDSGAIVNKIVMPPAVVPQEEEILPRYFRNMSKARKRKLQELLKDAKEGRLDLKDPLEKKTKDGEGEEGGEDDKEDEQPNFDENGEPTEHLLRRLGYHIPSVASGGATYRDKLDGCDYVVNEWVKPATPEIRKIRQDAMRNMTRLPLFEYVRQINYSGRVGGADNNDIQHHHHHHDEAIELRDDLTRRKRLAKKLQAGSYGLKLAEKIDPEALMNESSETSAKVQKALERYKKRIKKKREQRMLKNMKDPDAEEIAAGEQGKFQNLRSLTRTKKKPRLLKDDHIAFLRKRYTPGTRIRARDKQMEWLVAVVRDLRNSRVLVHYEGFPEYYNEWIDINSERLRFDPTLDQTPPEPVQPLAPITEPVVVLEDPKSEESQPAPDAVPEEETKKKPRKKAALKDKEEPPLPEPSVAIEPDQPVFEEGDAITVECVQCHVQLTQFRYCCTYCEKEEGVEPFNLCLWCFSSAFPEDHDHPRNSFAAKRLMGSSSTARNPVAGEIISKFERETFDHTYQEPQNPYQTIANPDDPDSPWNAMDLMSLENGQFALMQQWRQRKICGFCNDDDTTKDHFIGPQPFILSTTNRYGDEKKRIFWAHDACARYSPEVVQDRNGTWFNVAMAMRRGRNNKCAACREKGATIGCFDPKCSRSFHVPCTGKPLARFEEGVIFWCPQHEKELERRDAYHENFSCDSCAKILGVNPWWTCQPCGDDYFHSFDLCTQCFDTREIDHDHDKEDFVITSLEMKRKERLAQKAAQMKIQSDSVKKKSVNARPKFKGISSKMCSYCWSTNSSKWRKVYNGVLMCEDCFMAGPVTNQPMLPLVNGVDGDSLELPQMAPTFGGVGRYATHAEDYSHSPYFTRTTVSADRFDHSQSQAVYLDSYGPAEHQLYSLSIDTTYYDIPGRAPRWATHSGTDYHGTWLPQTVRRAVVRWTKPNDRILSNFLGRGTDAIECFLLGRRCTAVDINPAAITLSIRNCSFAIPPDNNTTIKAEHRPIIMQGDSRKLVGSLFDDESFDHVLSHPPYKDCVAYSTHIEGDLSRFNNAAEFQREMKSVIRETRRLLKMGRRCTLGIGDNREHCFYIPVSFQLIRQYIDEGFELEELVVKRQRYCAMFGLGTYLCVQFDFLCFTHEFIATLRKVPKENHDRMILEPDYSLLSKIKVSSTVRSIPSCPIERKSVVMGSVWTFKPTKEFDFPTLCISRMVERFGRNDANWEEFKLEINNSDGNLDDRDEDDNELGIRRMHHDLLQNSQIAEEDNLVSYERDRLQQIQENNRMLLALGLITELSETSDDIGHQEKILREEPCLSKAETALMCIAHVPGVGSNMAHHTSSTICLKTREQINMYRMAIMDLAKKAREQLPVTGALVVGVQDVRTRDNKLYPLGMLVLEDIIRVVGEEHLRLKELIEAVPDGYQKDRRKVTSWEEYQEEPNWPDDQLPEQHLPIVHACYLVFTKVKEYNAPTRE